MRPKTPWTLKPAVHDAADAVKDQAHDSVQTVKSDASHTADASRSLTRACDTAPPAHPTETHERQRVIGALILGLVAGIIGRASYRTTHSRT
jgi:hypothetical protein